VMENGTDCEILSMCVSHRLLCRIASHKLCRYTVYALIFQDNLCLLGIIKRTFGIDSYSLTADVVNVHKQMSSMRGGGGDVLPRTGRVPGVCSGADACVERDDVGGRAEVGA